MKGIRKNMIKITDKAYFFIGILDILSSIFAYCVFLEKQLLVIIPLLFFVAGGGLLLILSSIKIKKTKK